MKRLIATSVAALLAAACSGCDMAKSDAPALRKTSGLPTIRIKAGAEEPFKDSQGVIWSPDSGFEGGTIVDRPDLPITGTKTPELYFVERYSMEFYSFKVPNGAYVVKLHFSEDYEDIGGQMNRIFTFAVKDGDAKTGRVVREVKDFGPWKMSGAQYKAWVETVPVDVKAGAITIAFTPQVENPQINAIEIVPK